MNNFKEAIVIVRDTIKKDPELYYAYQANIAMSFYDEYRRTKKKFKNKEDVKSIGNQAAKNFLDLWIN